MGVMAHYVGADMLHAPYVVFDAYGPACKGRVGRSEYNRKQSEHFAKASQFVRSIHLYKHLADDAGAFRAEVQGIDGKFYCVKAVSHFGECLHAPFHESVAEGDHQVTDMSVLVCRVGCEFPAMKHGGRY